ncbi:hypothetical protein [Maribacter sp. HTCC2170]|uniref:hypothetical protein n=1 Tax=Maribacter sp. (strain HTCC2170 / KCCM 42371) TaxID=313603 RepID=UPI00006AFCBA|nr:hypothetical protein [Maribacter sp. HTCC2170]EAR01529.1 hypothetical protein FB2170_12431 [Maribacter sp. HTCC2170]
MSLTKIRLLAVLLLGTLVLHAQAVVKNSEHINGYNALHGETVYIHHNASLLLAGEQLYYSIYCLDVDSKLLSSLSKIAYVELVGANGEHIFRHKIMLKSGVGQGDFFIPTSVPTGNYKLLGYTLWMKNGSTDYFFKSDINIVNPFHKNQDLISEQIKSSEVDSTINDPINDGKKDSRTDFDKINIKTDRATVSRRAKVRLTIQNLDDTGGYGNYSISVRKKDGITAPVPMSAEMFLKSISRLGPNSPIGNDSIYLPELRGEILFGKVISKTTDVSVSNQKVALSIPGKDYVIKIAKTNEDGMFYFNLDKVSDQSSAHIQILSEDGNKNKIIMGNNQSPSVPSFKFNSLEFSPQMAELLVERSIHNQIENAFLDVKSDTFSPIYNTKQFYQKYNQVYDLDDYTRFNTIKEVILEVVDNVKTTKSSNGESELQIKGYENISGIRIQPMVMVDGLLLQDHTGILEYDARKVKKISVMSRNLKMGPQSYSGVIAFETLDGSFPSLYQNEEIGAYEMFGPLRQKSYFHQEYVEGVNTSIDHLPDFRYQLLWIPMIELKENSKIIDFYTSDVNGVFEICVEGITEDGIPISLKTDFRVK